jgi:hypothetical protein
MAEETPQSIFKGKVVTPDGTPLSGVNVTIKSKSNITDVLSNIGETLDNVTGTNITSTTPPDVGFVGRINESIITNDKGEWEFSFPTTDVNIDSVNITFEKENYDLKQIENPSLTSEIPLILNVPLNEEIPIDDLSPSTKSLFDTYKQDNILVLIRDGRIEAGHPFSKQGSGGRTIGTLYYKGNIVAYTVEDIVRFDKKIDKQTAIPAGEYYITLDVTSVEGLKKNYVPLKGKGKHPANWSSSTTRGVFARVGNEGPTAIQVLNYPKFYFNGIRIHAGSSENSSEGCIIVSNNRDDKGYLIGGSLNKSFEITKLIYDNDITRIIIINDFNKRTYKKS